MDMDPVTERSRVMFADRLDAEGVEGLFRYLQNAVPCNLRYTVSIGRRRPGYESVEVEDTDLSVRGTINRRDEIATSTGFHIRSRVRRRLLTALSLTRFPAIRYGSTIQRRWCSGTISSRQRKGISQSKLFLPTLHSSHEALREETLSPRRA